MKYVFGSIVIYSILIYILYLVKPGNKVYSIKMDNIGKKGILIIGIVIITYLSFFYNIVGLNDVWNGVNPKHRDQYEKMADNLLEGRLSFDYEVDSKLLDMENPYDYHERIKQNVDVKWDHAYYKGKYYMYFGIAPVINFFMPYKLITGKTILTYKVTFIYMVFIVIGFFSLFYMISKKYFKNLSFITYLISSISLSFLSIWYALNAPSLYCTAICAGICYMIYSIYFFFKAVYIEEKENKQILYAFLGSLFGALTFASRPTIGLINLIVIPMLIDFLKKKNITIKLILKLILASLPYFIIGILLMIYNYVRFDNIFEFGQNYQITIADQRQYGILNNFSIIKVIENYFGIYGNPCNTYGGILINYPIFLLFSLLLYKPIYSKIKEKGLNKIIISILIINILITIFEVSYTPFLIERYHMDIYFILSIALFILIGFINKEYIINYILIFTFIYSIHLFLIPYDASLTYMYPHILDEVKKLLSFNLL